MLRPDASGSRARAGAARDPPHASVHRCIAVDTVEIYFGFDQAELSDGAKTALLSVVKELEASPTLVVKLGGFTDPKGTMSYDSTPAQRRVEAVRRFLADKGVQLFRVQAIGMGSLDDRGIPDEKKRRVTVTLMTDTE